MLNSHWHSTVFISENQFLIQLAKTFSLPKSHGGEAKFIMDGISKKLIKDGIHSTIRGNFSRIGEFLATTLPSSAADEVSGAADDEQCCC